MWIKVEQDVNGQDSFFNPEHGSLITTGSGTGGTFNVIAIVPTSGNTSNQEILKSGYATTSDANDALEILMSSIGYEHIS